MTLPLELRAWAIKHHVGADAIADLSALLGAGAQAEATGKASEAGVSSRVRLAAPEHNMRLFRNNRGALPDERGVPVRFGLANDSKQLGERLRSADLIGWRRLLIGPHHVGSTLAQFVSIETKHEDWTPRPNDLHEQGQQRWATLVAAEGGFARFVTGPEGLK